MLHKLGLLDADLIRVRVVMGKAHARGETTIEGKVYKYALYKRPPGNPWQIKFKPPDGKWDTADLKNEDADDVATITKRIREALGRRAAAVAAAPAPAPALSPFRSGRRGTVRQSIQSEIYNISHYDTSASFATKRSRARETTHAKKRRTDRDDELKQLGRLDAALRRFTRLSELRKQALAAKRHAEKALAREKRRSERDAAKLAHLEYRYTELLSEFDGTDRDLKEAADDAEACLDAVPQFKMVGKGVGNGRGQVWPSFLRCMVFEQLVNGTPPSAICKNIVSDAAYLAPKVKVLHPTYRTVCRWRYELRMLTKALGAYRVAGAARVAMVGSDGTAYYQKDLVTASVLVDDDGDGDLSPVVLEAAMITPGKTAEAEVNEVALMAYSRGREALAGWINRHKLMFPEDDVDGLFPDPDDFGIDRLAGGGCVMGDTCNQANLFKQLFAQKAAEAFEARDPNWSTYDEATRTQKTRVFELDCWNHLRNIWFEHGGKAVVAHVKGQLKDDLANFDGYSRVSADMNQLARAVFKEFHEGGDYAKGKGRNYHTWLAENHPKVFSVYESRAGGSRQDMEFEAAVAIYINRPYYLEFLHHLMRDPGHNNILEDYLYVVLLSTEMNALVRCDAAMYVAFVEDLRWLAGSAHLLDNFSPFSMGLVADRFAQLMVD